jgi:hypothetical protein
MKSSTFSAPTATPVEIGTYGDTSLRYASSCPTNQRITGYATFATSAANATLDQTAVPAANQLASWAN